MILWVYDSMMGAKTRKGTQNLEVAMECFPHEQVGIEQIQYVSESSPHGLRLRPFWHCSVLSSGEEFVLARTNVTGNHCQSPRLKTTTWSWNGPVGVLSDHFTKSNHRLFLPLILSFSKRSCREISTVYNRGSCTNARLLSAVSKQGWLWDLPAFPQ